MKTRTTADVTLTVECNDSWTPADLRRWLTVVFEDTTLFTLTELEVTDGKPQPPSSDAGRRGTVWQSFGRP